MSETSPAGQTEEFKRDSLYWHKTVLTGKFAHWCNDWDGLPIDETCDEFTSCHDCYGRDPTENAEIDSLKERLRLDRPAQIC